MKELLRLAPAVLECAAVWLVLRMTLAPAAGRGWLRWTGPVLCSAVHVLAWTPVERPGAGGDWQQAARIAVPALLWLLYACAAYEGKLIRKAMVVAAIFALLCFASVQVGKLTVSAFRLNLVVGYNHGISVPVTGIASRCFVLALCMAYGQFQQTRRGLQPLSRPTAALLTLLPLAGLGCICAIVWPEVRSRLGPDADIERVPWVLCILLVALELVLVLGVAWTLRALKLQGQCQQQLRQQEKEHGQMKELHQMFCSQRIQTHEYRNRLTVLSMLLAQQQYGEASAYLQQLTQYTYQDSPTVQTNHPVADAVLNLKYTQAREQQTAVRFMVGDLSSLPFTDDEVVKLLGNLLDNALDACRKLDEHREINVKLLCQEGELVLSVRNPLPPEDAALRQDPMLHGFGLQTVDRVLRNHQVSYAISREDGWFQFTAMSWPGEQES